MRVLSQGIGTRRLRVRSREEASLNLIPLIDIMSVMVAFLLVYSTEAEIVQNSKGVAIPQSTAEVRPQVSVVVMITQEQLFVQGEPVATMAQIEDPKTPVIESLRQILQRPMAGLDAAASHAALAAQEITVMADKSLPYEVVRKVMATCTAASYGKISLAVLQKEGSDAVNPPGSGAQS
jgi:biopolymer transport protein TolR